jgi:DNA-binding response OmpR family regulator
MLYHQGDQRTFMNIGLLEDNPAILDYMTVALEMAGHQVQTYTYGASLIESLLTGSDAHSPLPYDLIIVDLLLPGNISGYETVKQIQEVIPLNKLPVIIISAGSRAEIEFVKTNLPTVPVLRKPFRMSALFQLIYDLKIG